MFYGINDGYYDTVMKHFDNYENSKIVVSRHRNKDIEIKLPINNLLGKFDKYVYTKDYFDPAPRLVQECFYYGKEVIYERDIKNDGGWIYFNRGLNNDLNLMIEILNKYK